MKGSEIFYRKQQVAYYFIQGYNQSQIAEKLDISTKTVYRDLSDMKNESYEWFSGFCTGGILFYHKRNFDCNDKIMTELWKVFESTESEAMKLKVLDSIGDKARSSSEMLSESYNLKNIGNTFSPLGFRYRPINEETDILSEQNVQQKDKTSE